MAKSRASEKDIVVGKILRKLCAYADSFEKKGDEEKRKVVQECITMVHESYWDDWGQPADENLDGRRSFRTDVTEG